MESDTTDSVAEKICALKSALEKEFDFDTYNIPKNIIDAFVEYIKVEKDRYIWIISLVDGAFTCLAFGKAKYPDVSLVDFPSNVQNRTGGDCQWREIIEDKVHLMTITVTVEDERDFLRQSPKYRKCNKYQDLIVELYI